MTFKSVTFGNLYLEPSRNGIYKSKQYSGSGTALIKMEELFNKKFIGEEISHLDMYELSESEKERFLVKEGDLIFSRTSVVPEGVGKCSIITNLSSDLAFESNLIRVRLDNKTVNPLYCFYYFQTSSGRGKIIAISNGVAVRTIRGSDLTNITIELPSLKNQTEIVNILSPYDDLIENNRRRIQLLEEAARLLYQEWFVRLRFPGHEHTKIVDGVPEGWQSVKLQDVANITMGQSPSSSYYNHDGIGLPFHQGVSDYGDRFPSNTTYCSKEFRIAEAGDILFSVRAPVGRINITLDKIVIGRGLASIRSKMNHQEFLFYCLKNIFFKDDLMGTGAIYAAITKKELTEYCLLYPSNVIIESFIEYVKPIDQMITSLHMSNRNLIKARDLFLPRLMNGVIPV